MAFPSKFPHTFNFRTIDGQYSQQVTKQDANSYTVKTWVHHNGTAVEIANADELSRREAIEQLDYQSEYASQMLEDFVSFS